MRSSHRQPAGSDRRPGALRSKFAVSRADLAAAHKAMEALAQRSMKLQVTIQDGQVWLGDGKDTVHIEMPDAVIGTIDR